MLAINLQWQRYYAYFGIIFQFAARFKHTNTMSLKTTVDAGIKQAMLAKDQDRLRALRAIKSMILLEESKEGGSGELSEADEIKLLTKAAKQRKDSLEVFLAQNRADLAEKERAELSVIEEFLPKQMNEAELKAALKAIVTKVGAAGPGDMGKVMGIATKELAGKADGKAISAMVKTLLSE
jgi:uncharacterized protein YqeY